VNNLSNTTCIGYNAGGVNDITNHIELGNTSVNWIGGQVGWSTYSDARIKEDIREDVPGLNFINKLRPVTYHLNIHTENEIVHPSSRNEEPGWDGKYDIEQMKMTGFLAQEVEQAAQESGYDFSGVQKPEDPNGLYSLRYAEFVVPLVKAVQELNAELKTEVEMLKAQNEELRARLDKLEAEKE
jgi:hypothetical protein